MKFESSSGRPVLWGILCLCGAACAQNGKTFIQWLQQYSPTGYFVINDYETRKPRPNWHAQWVEASAQYPLGAVAVHETGHMRNLDLNSTGSQKSYYIGNLQDYKFTPGFTPYYSSQILPDIPQSLRNFITEVYIDAEPGLYSVGSGIIGLMEEWNQYITGLKSGVEMAECYRANFNTTAAWNALANDVTTSVWSNAEFRYFCLRYVMRAKISHPTVYNAMLASQGLKQNYTHMVNFAEKTMAEWIAVLKSRNMDTLTRHGFDWHWKFWNEIQKPEYKNVEALLLVPPVAIAPRARRANFLAGAAVPWAEFDLRGRRLASALRTPAIYPISSSHPVSDSFQKK